jgi:hypothetical protein
MHAGLPMAGALRFEPRGNQVKPQIGTLPEFDMRYQALSRIASRIARTKKNWRVNLL